MTGLGPANSIPDAIAAINAAGENSELSAMSVKMAGCNPALITSGMTSGAAVAPACGPTAAGAPLSLFGNDTPLQNQAVAFNNAGGSNNGLAKIDYHLNDRNNFNGGYSYRQRERQQCYRHCFSVLAGRQPCSEPNAARRVGLDAEIFLGQ